MSVRKYLFIYYLLLWMHHSNHTESSPEQEDACLDAVVLHDSPDQGVVHFPEEAKRLNLYKKNLVC